MASCRSYKLHIKDVDTYIDWVDANPQKVSKDIKAAIDNVVVPVLDRNDVYFDTAMYDKCIEFCERWYYSLFPYQRFIYALVFLYFNDFNGLPVFREIFVMMGRGNGKTGMIAPLIHFLLSSGHGIKGYNCDVVSNSEAQAKLTFSAIYDVVNCDKWKTAYDVTKETIRCKATKSEIHYRSSNGKTADGFKAGILVFDELHSYEETNPMTTYKSELGKVMHPRIICITTNGYIRGAVFDRHLEQAEDVLAGNQPKRRMLPLLYRIDNEEEAKDPSKWIKANPSIDYMPNLKDEIESAWIDAQTDIRDYNEFLTKRMNLPRSDSTSAVTSWENILATNQQVPLENLKDCQWVCGIDFSKLNDWAAACLLTKKGDKIYMIRQVWANSHNPFFTQLKAPVKEWAQLGLLQIVSDVEIRPELITHWVLQQIQSGHNVIRYAVDSYRFSLLRKAMEDDLGIDVTSKKQLLMVRPNDVQKIVPVIDSAFNRHSICVGDDPVFRWCTNNSTLIPKANGNFIYGKQEPKLRKTDLFFAFVHAMTIIDKVQDINAITLDDFITFTY